MMENNSLPDASTPLPYPQTPESAREWFYRYGICQTDWAKKQAVPRMVLVDLIHGRSKGRRGEAHRGAVLLGLKPDPAKVLTEHVA